MGLVLFLLRMEGVDFSATVEDTQQLSAIRGSSLTLLAAPRAVEAWLAGPEARRLGVAFEAARHTVLTGASQGAFLFEAAGDDVAQAVRRAVTALLRAPLTHAGSPAAPAQHLSFVVDVTRGDDLAAYRRAFSMNRMRQLHEQNWALPALADPSPPPEEPEDRVRPADASLWMPPGRVLAGAETDGSDGPGAGAPAEDAAPRRAAVSRSFADRTRYGRLARQSFYRHALPASVSMAGISFTDTFEDLVADPPDETPDNLRNKLALFYADGNRFGALAEKARTLQSLSAFSRSLIGLQSAMLGDIIGWYKRLAGVTEARDDDQVRFVPSDFAGAVAIEARVARRAPGGMIRRERVAGLRFETLLWGGDELMFVMPAWLGMAFAEGFFRIVEGSPATAWRSPAGDPLSFGAALVFAHHKTPVRQLKAIARAMADDAKDAMGALPGGGPANVLQIESFEGLAVPDHDLGGYRTRRWGAAAEAVRPWLTLRGEELPHLTAAVNNAKGLGPDAAAARSKLYEYLRLAEVAGLTTKAAEEAIADAEGRYGALADTRAHRSAPLTLGLSDMRPRGVELAMLSDLWDYVSPLGVTYPLLGEPLS